MTAGDHWSTPLRRDSAASATNAHNHTKPHAPGLVEVSSGAAGSAPPPFEQEFSKLDELVEHEEELEDLALPGAIAANRRAPVQRC